MVKGFSLIELLVVIAILSLLATLAFPLTELAHRRNQEEDLRRALREIRSALDAYKRTVDSGLIARQVGASGYPPNLEVLVEGSANAQIPSGAKFYFLRRVPRDPFADAAVTDAAQTWGLRSYESSHSEPKPGKDVYDVYSLAKGVGLDGRPYRDW